jgi:endonuclease III-like uncharacterized protein
LTQSLVALVGVGQETITATLAMAQQTPVLVVVAWSLTQELVIQNVIHLALAVRV